MESANRKALTQALKGKANESSDPTKSESESEEKSEEYKNFEDFSRRLGSLTRSELDAIFEKEQEEKRSRKASHN